MRIRETQAYGEGNEDIGYSLTMEFDPIGSRRNMQRRKYLERKEWSLAERIKEFVA